LTETIEKISNGSQKEKYPRDFKAVVKVTTDQKEMLDDFLAFLKIGFDCELKSKKLYSEDQDKFYQYIAIQTKEDR
jgi:predicted ATP-dependent protease